LHERRVVKYSHGAVENDDDHRRHKEEYISQIAPAKLKLPEALLFLRSRKSKIRLERIGSEIPKLRRKLRI